MTKLIVTGTDTDIGKTVASAMLVRGLGANYWKPVQSGVEGAVDTRTVQKLSGLPDERFFEESYVLSEPLSPHRAAEIDLVDIKPDSIKIPDSDRPLIIEGAGGLMVPLTRQELLITRIQKWGLPVVLCTRTTLGTINHTLLSIEALWARKVPIKGLLFIGPENKDNIKTIAEFSGEKVLGWLPWLDDITPKALDQAFRDNFNKDDFL